MNRPYPHSPGCICVNCETLRKSQAHVIGSVVFETDKTPRWFRALTDTGIPVGPIESEAVRDLWESLGGTYGQPFGDCASITIVDLQRAVRSGKIRL